MAQKLQNAQMIVSSRILAKEYFIVVVFVFFCPLMQELNTLQLIQSYG
jgi:hypothetical protein